MKNIFDYANQYIEESDWKDLAALKFCLFSIGVLVGMKIPVKGKKRAGKIAFLVFVITYLPLMKKFFRIVFED